MGLWFPVVVVARMGDAIETDDIIADRLEEVLRYGQSMLYILCT
jgi:hypothetical protein